MSLLNETPLTDLESGFGTAEYSERLIRPGANVGFFGWLALLGIPFLLLFLIYTKMENPGVVSATRAEKLNAPIAMPMQAAPAGREP
jgi:hypothetical protein